MLHAMDKILAPGFWALLVKPFYITRFIVGIIPFLIRNRPAVCEPRIFAFFQALRRDPSTANMRIFQAGFCWGGRYTFLLARDHEGDRVVRPGKRRRARSPCSTRRSRRIRVTWCSRRWRRM